MKKNNQKYLTTQLFPVDINSRCGDGVVIVRHVGRTAATNLTVRNSNSKAGGEPARRGSELSIPQSHSTLSINMKSVSNIKNLVAAYESIKSNPGKMTPALEPTTLDGLELSYLKKVQDKTKRGVYKFSPARRVHIPKPTALSSSSSVAFFQTSASRIRTAINCACDKCYTGWLGERLT